MYSIFLLFLYFYSTNSFFSKNPLKQPARLLSMNKYEFSKEYFEFYVKFKQPLLLNTDAPDYDMFAKKHEKNYFIFEKNFKNIQETNAQLKSQNNSFSVEINEFADTVDLDNVFTQNIMNNDIDKTQASKNPFLKMVRNPIHFLKKTVNNNIKRFSWNDTGLLSPVKNQLSCGSCWAFSTTSCLETFMRKQNYTVERLSEQELVDCSDKNSGCNGGLMHLAFDYIIDNQGITTNDQYPYNATTGLECLTNKTRAIGSNVQKYAFTIPESVQDLKLSVLQNPVAIALDAGNVYFRFYKEGVIDVPQNVSKSINHAVLLVGYDYDEKGMYWIIQNSWGEQWGDKGFCKIRVAPKEGVLLSQVYGVYPIE